MDECEKWLADFLKKAGMALCDTVREEAKIQGFSKTQLKAARKSLGVKCLNDWASNEGETINWFWYLEEAK